MHQRCPNEVETKTAVAVHAIIARSIETAFPTMSIEDHDALFVAIIARLARMRGWNLRPEYAEAEDK